jgi:hypothetical protein
MSELLFYLIYNAIQREIYITYFKINLICLIKKKLCKEELKELIRFSIMNKKSVVIRSFEFKMKRV